MLIRRIHMYLGLFFAPWMFMYALSTIAMNHRQHLRRLFGMTPPRLEKEGEVTFDGAVPDGAPPEAVAGQILSALHLDGAHSVGKPGPGGKLVINRLDMMTPRRITFTPADHRVVVERQVFQTTGLLDRLHRRRGYDPPYAADRFWGASVDLAILAMIFWAGSGLWLWWEMKVTRVTGALFAAGGIAVFALFLATL